MIKSIAAAASLLALAAAMPVSAKKAAAPATTIAVPEIGFTEWTLANGLRIIAIPDSGTATITTSLWYEVGSKHDPEGRSGFAHLFEHILSRKTENMPYNMINRLTEDVGGVRNASTGIDRTNYYETVPAQYLETMLWTHAERMARPVVDDEVFERERSVVKEELRQRVLAPPYGRLSRFVLPENAYDVLPQRRPGIGSIEQLDSATLDDARAFHQAYYGPDTATLIVAGNFEIERLKALADQYFAAIPPRANPVPLTITAREPERTVPRIVHATAPNVPLPVTGSLWQIPEEAHPDIAAIEVLDAILSLGDNSRLHDALISTGKAGDIGELRWGSEEGGFLAQFAISGEDADEANIETTLAGVMDRIRREKVSEAELAEAKNELLSASLEARETAQGRAFELGEALVSTGDTHAADKRLKAIAAVTAEDVLRVAQRWLRPEARVDFTYVAGADDPASYANPAPRPAYASVPPPSGEPAKVRPEGEREAPPPPGAVPAIAQPAFIDTQLSNGIRVVAAQTGNVPLATITLVFPGGAAGDPVGKAGVAGLAAGLANKGTSSLSPKTIAARLESLGAVLGAGADEDGSSINLTAPVANLKEAGKLLAAVVRDASYPEHDVEIELARAIDGLTVTMKDPASLADRAAIRALYGDAPYGSFATFESLPRITREDLIAYRETWWHPGAAQIVVSGGIAPEKAKALVQDLFGEWKSKRPVPAPVAHPAGTAKPVRTIVIDMPEAGQAAVLVGVRSLTRADADYYPLFLANSVLGSGSNGRLFEEVRTKRGLSYGSYSGLDARADTGLLTATAQTKHETAAEVAKVILDEFGKLSSAPADEAWLEKRRVFIAGGRARSLETSAGFNTVVAGLLQQGIEPGEAILLAQRLAAVSPDAAAGAAARYLAPDAATLVVVGDAAQFLDSLKAIRADVEVVPIDRLDFSREDLLARETVAAN